MAQILEHGVGRHTGRGWWKVQGGRYEVACWQEGRSKTIGAAICADESGPLPWNVLRDTTVTDDAKQCVQSFVEARKRVQHARA